MLEGAFAVPVVEVPSCVPLMYNFERFGSTVNKMWCQFPLFIDEVDVISL